MPSIKDIDITTLTPQERLELIDVLWESLDPEEMPVTEAQKRELDSRLKAFGEGALGAFAWEDVKQRLKLDE